MDVPLLPLQFSIQSKQNKSKVHNHSFYDMDWVQDGEFHTPIDTEDTHSLAFQERNQHTKLGNFLFNAS